MSEAIAKKINFETLCESTGIELGWCRTPAIVASPTWHRYGIAMRSKRRYSRSIGMRLIDQL